MKEKILLKTTSISYSKFLSSKEDQIHTAEPSDIFIDNDFYKRFVWLHYHQIYVTKKSQNFLYRIIFFGFGFLFLILGLIVFFKTTNFAGHQFFNDGMMVKNYINLSCLFLAGGAFFTGYMIHPESEAIRYLVKKVETEQRIPAQHLQIEFVHEQLEELVFRHCQNLEIEQVQR